MLFLKQPIMLPLLCHKLVTTCHIDSKKVANSKLKLYPCTCEKIEIMESIGLPK